MKRSHKIEMPPSQVIDEEEREADANELFFDDEPAARRAGDEVGEDELYEPPERVREAGLTEASLPDHGPTDDDATPETLIDDTGARSPSERGESFATDEHLSIRDLKEIGAGRGLDEAELGRLRPLDGRPWDGDPDDPL